MTDPVPFVRVVLFEGAPIQAFHDDEACREFLLDVMADDADRYQVWSVPFQDTPSIDDTVAFAKAWSELFDFGSGDDPEDLLRPFPSFISALIGEELIAEYRQGQDAA